MDPFVLREATIFEADGTLWVQYIYIYIPIGSMYGIFTYIYHKNQLNVGKYTSPMDTLGYKGGKNKKKQAASCKDNGDK